MNWAKAWKRYAKWARMSTGAWDMRRQPDFWSLVQKYQSDANGEWIGSEHARWFHYQLCPGGGDHVRYPEDRPAFARDCAACFCQKLRRSEELKTQAEDAAARAIARYVANYEIAKLHRQLQNAKQNERERCAKFIENGRFVHEGSPEAHFAKQCAAAIRSLGDE
jgi:hypothetical protein